MKPEPLKNKLIETASFPDFYCDHFDPEDIKSACEWLMLEMKYFDECISSRKDHSIPILTMRNMIRKAFEDIYNGKEN